MPSPSRVSKKLMPGQPGTKRLSALYGDALVCVRYRQDRASGRRFTTIEIVVDPAPETIPATLADPGCLPPPASSACPAGGAGP